ncbi:serine hydrolase domain-containing protein [Microbacterium sp. H83]|uniref:serine hydrolase domain-containing protein n=1 Tax=Microbacterium sp. H83 TaxID=1827324 RepID=UPI0007F34761|nr:serine hydrolase domain-containing protein [Microbacterium sp. H83]OAN43444.1 hydrolase [Microbacterium sp. H83]
MTEAATILDTLVREVERSGFGAHGLHVLVGDDGAEHRWTADVREEIHSVTKAVSVLAAGIAQDEGLISLDSPVVDDLPDIRPGAGAEEVTLRQLLSMSSGIDLPWSETMMTDWPDLAAEFLSRPSQGRVFQYSNASTYTAMAVLAARVGDVRQYLEPRLFAPLGLEDLEWRRSPAGRVLAGEGIALRTEEMARLGRLIRDRGVWRGDRLVSSEIIDAMHSDWVRAGSTRGYERYALSGWDGPGPGWRLHGAYGQLIVFHERAVVTVSAADHLGADAFAAFVTGSLEH